MRAWWRVWGGAAVAVAVALALGGCGRVGFGDADAGPGTGPDAPAATGYAAAVLADGPLGYWRLDDPSTIARDETGRYDGTYNGGGCTRGVPGALAGDSNLAASFDGCYIDLQDRFAFTGTAPYSIEAWFSTDTNGGAYQHLFTRQTRGTGPVDGYALLVQRTGPDRGLYAERTIATANIEVPHQAIADGFHHAVETYDGAAMRVFVDGIEVATIPDARALAAYTVHAYIGSSGMTAVNYFRGTIDEVAIYDRALAADRVAAHHTLGVAGP